MPRYFLHLRDPRGSVTDDEGAELADDEAALAHAIWCVRSVASDCVLTGKPINLAAFLVICNAAGEELRRLFFGEVITIDAADVEND